MVLLQFRVRVPDLERFRAASKKHTPTIAELSGRNQAVYVSESDPTEVCTHPSGTRTTR